MLFVGDEAEKQALLLGEPDLFFSAPGYDGWPLVMLRLAYVDVGRWELVTDAWRMRAPDEIAGCSRSRVVSLPNPGQVFEPARAGCDQPGLQPAPSGGWIIPDSA